MTMTAQDSATISCSHCGGAARLIDDNGCADPANGNRWEQYECVNCGNTWSKTLRA